MKNGAGESAGSARAFAEAGNVKLNMMVIVVLSSCLRSYSSSQLLQYLRNKVWQCAATNAKALTVAVQADQDPW